MRATCVTLDSSSHLSAYRDASIQPLCGVCHEPTTASIECPRCKTPLCTEHATTGGQRCAACEATYEQLLDDRRRDPVPAWTLPLVYTASAVGAAMLVPYVAARTGSVALSAMAGLAAALLPALVAWYRRRRLRPAFLRETPKRRSLKLRTIALPPAESIAALPQCPLGVASLVMSLLFFLPGLPVVAITFGGISVYRGAHGHDTSLGKAGVIIGIVMLCLQVVFFYGMTACHI